MFRFFILALTLLLDLASPQLVTPDVLVGTLPGSSGNFNITAWSIVTSDTPKTAPFVTNWTAVTLGDDRDCVQPVVLAKATGPSFKGQTFYWNQTTEIIQVVRNGSFWGMEFKKDGRVQMACDVPGQSPSGVTWGHDGSTLEHDNLGRFFCLS